MSNGDQFWEEYLNRRPNLNKWYSYCEQNPSYQTCDLFTNRVSILKDKVMKDGKTEYGRKVADLDDDEALAYFVYVYLNTYFNFKFNNNLLIDSKAIKHVQQPSISLDEAKYVDDRSAIRQYVPYIHLLCSRELGGDFTSNESLDDMNFIDNLLQTIKFYRFHEFHHMVWDTEQDLVRTVVRYKNYRNLFKGHTDSDILIDRDFLEDYLLAPKPDPIEIDRNTWHDMSVRLVEKLDDENKNNRIRMETMNFLEFVSTELVSCFLTRNIEELAFMESVYDFFVSACLGFPYTGRVFIRDGMLDPKIFDMFREYGASFAKPLLESVLCDMNPTDEEIPS